MNAYSYTDIGGRSHNEDAVCIRQTGENQFLAVLADGLGGHGGGEIASEIAVETLENGWKGISSPAVLYDLILQAHRRILSSQTSVCRMRSTIVALSVGSGHADWAYAGDSRLYQFYNGELVYQTRDHSASQVAVLMGEITQDEIRFHKDRLPLKPLVLSPGASSDSIKSSQQSARLRQFRLQYRLQYTLLCNNPVFYF